MNQYWFMRIVKELDKKTQKMLSEATRGQKCV